MSFGRVIVISLLPLIRGFGTAPQKRWPTCETVEGFGLCGNDVCPTLRDSESDEMLSQALQQECPQTCQAAREAGIGTEAAEIAASHAPDYNKALPAFLDEFESICESQPNAPCCRGSKNAGISDRRALLQTRCEACAGNALNLPLAPGPPRHFDFNIAFQTSTVFNDNADTYNTQRECHLWHEKLPKSEGHIDWWCFIPFTCAAAVISANRWDNIIKCNEDNDDGWYRSPNRWDNRRRFSLQQVDLWRERNGLPAQDHGQLKPSPFGSNSSLYLLFVTTTFYSRYADVGCQDSLYTRMCGLAEAFGDGVDDVVARDIIRCEGGAAETYAKVSNAEDVSPWLFWVLFDAPEEDVRIVDGQGGIRIGPQDPPPNLSALSMRRVLMASAKHGAVCKPNEWKASGHAGDLQCNRNGGRASEPRKRRNGAMLISDMYKYEDELTLLGNAGPDRFGRKDLPVESVGSVCSFDDRDHNYNCSMFPGLTPADSLGGKC
uniref:Uncharacterized protein n=1 Tax=Calcidiscus leptoporus TaxID=127549 RepID=A0A7S0INC5_9EUKA